jgi:16S rRNA (uracil1498-N3)-methyltransferase
MCIQSVRIRPDRLFYTPDIQTTLELPKEEAGHCIRVLRLSQGDEITLTDGKGSFYLAHIAIISGTHCTVTVKATLDVQPLWQGHLHIAFAPAKNMDRNEWFVEKATEIGIDELTLLNCRFSERRVVKVERINKIIVSAVKQSLKARVPKLNGITDFETFVSQDFRGRKFIAHCKESERFILQDLICKGEDALVLIGPEGDFSEDEIKKAVEKGFIPVSLGKSRLRTETAALVACHILNLTNQLK